MTADTITKPQRPPFHLVAEIEEHLLSIEEMVRVAAMAASPEYPHAREDADMAAIEAVLRHALVGRDKAREACEKLRKRLRGEAEAVS